MDPLKHTVVLRGGGDLATGVAQSLWHAGFRLLILETSQPLAIRRTVCLCTAIQSEVSYVEDMCARTITNPNQCESIWQQNEIPILVDPQADCIETLHPTVLVDAILAKKNLGTNRSMAPITIALGPGFCAPNDVDAVIETMRGHRLGRIITEGEPLPNTGVPGEIGGESAKRVVHAPCKGVVKHIAKIGDWVSQGDPLFTIDQTTVTSPLNGILRGLIEENIQVKQGLKLADVDPRTREEVDCYSISDKARSLGNATLQAISWLGKNKNL